MSPVSSTSISTRRPFEIHFVDAAERSPRSVAAPAVGSMRNGGRATIGYSVITVHSSAGVSSSPPGSVTVIVSGSVTE